MKTLIKTKAFQKVDTITSISLSSGTTGLFLNRYKQGVNQIEESFSVIAEIAHKRKLFPYWKLRLPKGKNFP